MAFETFFRVRDALLCFHMRFYRFYRLLSFRNTRGVFVYNTASRARILKPAEKRIPRIPDFARACYVVFLVHRNAALLLASDTEWRAQLQTLLHV